MFSRKKLFFITPFIFAAAVFALGRTSVPGRIQDGAAAALKPFFLLAGRQKAGASADSGGEAKIKELAFANQMLEEENSRLRNALLFREKRKDVKRGVDVLFVSRELGKEFLVVDKGKDDGIREGDSALDANEFFVGTVREASAHTAKIAVASNSGETHSIQLAPSGIRALAKGIGARTFSVDLVEGEAEIKEGDFVGLSSVNGSHPVLLAEVASVRREVSAAFQEIHAVLLSRPDQLGEVFIVSRFSPE